MSHDDEAMFTIDDCKIYMRDLLLSEMSDDNRLPETIDDAMEFAGASEECKNYINKYVLLNQNSEDVFLKEVNSGHDQMNAFVTNINGESPGVVCNAISYYSLNCDNLIKDKGVYLIYLDSDHGIAQIRTYILMGVEKPFDRSHLSVFPFYSTQEQNIDHQIYVSIIHTPANEDAIDAMNLRRFYNGYKPCK